MGGEDFLAQTGRSATYPERTRCHILEPQPYPRPPAPALNSHLPQPRRERDQDSQGQPDLAILNWQGCLSHKTSWVPWLAVLLHPRNPMQVLPQILGHSCAPTPHPDLEEKTTQIQDSPAAPRRPQEEHYDPQDTLSETSGSCGRHISGVGTVPVQTQDLPL